MAIRAYSEGLAREASIVGDFVQRWDDDRHSTRPSDQSSRRGIRRLNWRVDEEKGKGSRRGEARNLSLSSSHVCRSVKDGRRGRL